MYADDWTTTGTTTTAVYDDGLRRASYPFYPQSIKLEESSAIIVPSHYSPYPYHHSPPSHPPLPVQHTDDAASKETQYLRRRCFNCHTTEPPSWRRSTLNPGKIVCNKCGLYERTHLRARPLRFDELRVGGRRGSATAAAGRSPTSHPSSIRKASAKAATVRSSAGIVKRSSQSPPLTTQSPSPGIPIRIPSVPLDVSNQSPHLRKAHTSPPLGYSPYTPPPLSTSSPSSSVSSLSSLSSFSTSGHHQQPIMNSLNPINNSYNIPPMSSLTGGMIPNPMASLEDDSSHYAHHHHHPQLHQQHHYNFTASKVWSSEPESMGMGMGMGMGLIGLSPFVGAGSP